MSDFMAELRKMVEQIQRLPPPLVIQVSEAMPDDLVFDYTATSQAMEWDRWMDGKWVETQGAAAQAPQGTSRSHERTHAGRYHG